MAANIIRVYIGDNSYKAFACKDKTRLEDLKPQILEKFEISLDQIDNYAIYERKGDNDRLLAITDKPLKIVSAWKKDGPGTFWLKSLDGKPAAPAPVPDGANPPPPKPVAALEKPELPKMKLAPGKKAEDPPEWLSRQKRTAEESDADREVWERTQRRAFIGWCNHHLKKRQMVIETLETDFADGIKLINVLEELCKTKLPNYDLKPRVQIQKVQNLNIALNFIKQQGIKLIGVDAQAFINGNAKLILGTIWLLIHKFEIADISEAALSSKDGLLLWCSNKTAGYKNVKVENFHNSWQDGMAFCALIHKHRPDLIKFDTLDPANKKENLELAFSVADKHLDIPRLLEAEDLISIPKPDERSMITYLSQLFAKFSSTQKSELAVRRIERVIALTAMNDKLKVDYEQKAQKLSNWITTTTTELQQRGFGTTSTDVEDKLTLFLKYKAAAKTQQTAFKLDVEGLYNNIATKLWADSRPPFTPAEGLSTAAINEKWDRLNDAEKSREEALRAELERLHKLEYLAKKFAGKADLFEAWLTEKKDFISKDDLGSSLHAVQSKIRRHEAFEAQVATNQLKQKELKDLTKEIVALGNTEHNVEQNRVKKIDESLAELAALSEARKKALHEKLEYYTNLDKQCSEFSRKAEDLYVWLDSASDSLADPVVVNSAPAVQALLDVLDSIKKQQLEKFPLYEETSGLAEEITQANVDLNLISEFNIKQITAKWKAVIGRIEARKRELNMEMIKHTRNERLKVDFAKKAKEFVDWVDEKKVLINADATPEEKLAVVQKCYEDRDVGTSKLNVLEELNQLLVDAHITDLSAVTDHTMPTLVLLRDQYIQLLKDKIRLVESQITAKKMSELTPEQLQEFKVTFAHFDCDGDNKLSIHEFRAGCQGLGIDMSDEELKAVAEELDVTEGCLYFEQFVQFMVSRTQIRDTFEEVLASFTTLAGGKDFMNDEHIKTVFKGNTMDYIIANMHNTPNGRDYGAFASSLFER